MFVPVFEEYESLFGDIGCEIPLVTDNGYWKDETLKEKEMFLKMETEKAKETYKPRFSKAESPFALAKEHLNMRQARAKGIQQMDLQAKLTTIATNIIKINNHIHKNKTNT
jgi:hypothetical protein